MAIFPLSLYHKEIPSFLLPFLNSKEMSRLKEVGMNCGVEYSSLPFFSTLPKSSRYDHSLGVSLISYHFSLDPKKALAGLFHDISSPCFAHTIDFLLGDHKKQEATEERTKAILLSSKSINEELNKLGIKLDEVIDYSIYPICDNPAPKLSADRLEYTLRNIYLFGYGSLKDIEDMYSNLTIGTNEYGEEELMFLDLETAKRFGEKALKTFEVYISKEDRYAMELLALSLKKAMEANLITIDDLYEDEVRLIHKLTSTSLGKEIWEDYRSLYEVTIDPRGKPIETKVRYIDPYIIGKGRLSSCDTNYKTGIASLLNSDFSLYLFGFRKQR